MDIAMKKNLNKNVRNSYIVLFFLVFSFFCIDNDMLSAATVEDKKWSFEFNELPVPDVLNNISTASGVEIVLKGDIEERFITKSYIDHTIDNILLDMFSNENLAALFNYDDKGLASIKIWILPEGEKGNIIRDYIHNAPEIPVATENYRNIPKHFTRSRINNIPNRTDSKSNPNSEEKKTNPFVSFRKADSSSPIDDSLGNDPTDNNSSDPETVDVIPLPEIVITLGLEPPPMPPGLSFN